MTVLQIVDYVNLLMETDEDAILNLPNFQNWCYELSELDKFEEIAKELGWDK